MKTYKFKLYSNPGNGKLHKPIETVRLMSGITALGFSVGTMLSMATISATLG